MRIIVLFKLKPGVDAATYEEWARTEDITGVRALSSVEDFQVLRTTGLFGGGEAPYDYIEVIDVDDLDAFAADASTVAMAKVAAKFQTFADSPKFILTQAL